MYEKGHQRYFSESHELNDVNPSLIPRDIFFLVIEVLGLVKVNFFEEEP